MKIKSIITIYFSSLSLFVIGQNKKPEYVFYTQTQSCHISWATNYDYVVNLYPDSSISFVIYSSDYKEGETSTIKNEYIGKYFFIGDTLNIQYLSKSENKKVGTRIGKSLQKVVSFGVNIDSPKLNLFSSTISPAQLDTLFNKTNYKALFYPPTKFIFKNKIIISLERPYPNMGLLDKGALEVEMLEKVFSSWSNTTIFKNSYYPRLFIYQD